MRHRQNGLLGLPLVWLFLCMSSPIGRADTLGRSFDGVWDPTGHTAPSITGSITIQGDRLVIDHKMFLHLGPPKLIPNYKLFFGKEIQATAFPVEGKSDIPLLRGNRICTGSIRWVVFSLYSPNILSMFVTAGNGLTGERDRGNCGSFGYMRSSDQIS